MINDVAIIGGGPAGLMAAITAKRNNPDLKIIIFDKNDIGSTLLPTGGGRCNLSYNENDIKTFAQNYPRGEKFLYSVFNKFFISDTIDFFNSIGIKTYTQTDNRIFPTTDKSLDVIFALKNEVSNLAIPVIKNEVREVEKGSNIFIINGKEFKRIVLATGGKKSDILKSVENFGHKILEQKPSLSSLEINEKYFSEISGVSLKAVDATAVLNNKKLKLNDDILFTHKGISGPLVYKISSIYSRENYNKNNPIRLFINIIGKENFDFQEYFNKNPKKTILNALSDFCPKSLIKVLLEENFIDINKMCSQINKSERLIIESFLTKLELNIIKPLKGGEIVSSGGIALNEICSSTMESKLVKGLYFCGEVIDVDGFCGGFNLQNCWSTGYIAGLNCCN